MNLLIGNDQIITVNGVRDSVTGQAVNGATVTAVVKDKSGAQVAGQDWPLTLTPLGNGNYRGILEDGLNLTPAIYTVEITIDAGDDVIAFFKLKVAAYVRDEKQV